MIILMYILTLSYFFLNLVFAWAWLKNPSFRLSSKPISLKNKICISLIIPVRDEAANILHLLKDLQAQSIEPTQFEVFIIDDHSKDETAEIVQQYIPLASYSLKIIPLLEANPSSPKKSAISQAMPLTQGELIVHTDGDCRVPKHWLALLYQLYEEKSAKFISSSVTFTKKRSLFNAMLTVEFASLVGSGAACLNMGYPNMCNGANLAYPKSVFYEVEGYEGVDQIASGDDEFLLHKVAHQYPGEIYFLKNPQATVYTEAPPHLYAFYQQRKRWASKWKYYRDFRVKLLAFFIFLIHFGLLLATLGLILDFYPLSHALLQMGFKFVGEWIFLGIILRFLKKAKYLVFIPLIQLIYPFYIVFFGLLAQSGTYEWKGRKLQ